MSNKRTLAVLFLLFLCHACATVKTLAPKGNHVDIAYYDKKSYCNSIPRVYSGLSHNVCLMYGEPSQTLNMGDSFNGVPYLLIDSAFSAATDTLLLPYTIYSQATKGSIKVN
ncbi:MULTISPECIES: YceK/YidQ family lipoprotein [Paraglaciecola]|uniref:YceK/YidQ family lipoprotein n=1 Tax=Paraglaciecola TaxID=1621534 RepID=UPI000587B534|nr:MULTISPECIES: YceK/YidQ family lipoprotein [Paraglaciecola]MBU3017437.1 YceK/YidQ family lipoprotein [Paraglaciecola agarilytica]MDO6558094.1 YceK/YidQ family lipoprotein [Paraglaciecola chathamensis]